MRDYTLGRVAFLSTGRYLSDMVEFNLLSAQRPDEELLQLMVAEVGRWYDDHKKQIIALENVFNESCTMDQLGFIHDKATGKLIAGSKIEWFDRMLGEKYI